MKRSAGIDRDAAARSACAAAVPCAGQGRSAGCRRARGRSACGSACRGTRGRGTRRATAAPAPTPNKGDVAWMLTSHRARAHDERPGAGAVLRRHGAREEHAVGADAGVRRVLADHGAVVRLRLQPRVHRGQRVLRRLRPAVPDGHVRLRRRATFAMAATFSKGVVDPRAACSSRSRRRSPRSPAA